MTTILIQVIVMTLLIQGYHDDYFVPVHPSELKLVDSEISNSLSFWAYPQPYGVASSVRINFTNIFIILAASWFSLRKVIIDSLMISFIRGFYIS